MFSEWTITKILNRVQVLSTIKEYNFNKLNCINSKPLLQAGNENLIEYKCFLPLHCNFCNPQNVIERLEDYAQTREPIDWVWNSEYMGMFVIDSIEKSVQNQIKGNIIYAELNFNLLEYPVDDNFLDQLTEEVDLSDVEQYTSSSNKFTAFAQTVKDSVVSNMQEAVTGSLLSDNLSTAAQSLLSTITDDICSDLSGFSITEIYNKADNYVDIISGSSSLTTSDITSLVSQVSSIPDLVLNSALRCS
ncbi:MAG: phage tail protein [Candidatus Gastranaerophilales bacterium]|nr:phage tail protein [Candidatus Gastranaerophilales bacterium]